MPDGQPRDDAPTAEPPAQSPTAKPAGAGVSGKAGGGPQPGSGPAEAREARNPGPQPGKQPDKQPGPQARQRAEQQPAGPAARPSSPPGQNSGQNPAHAPGPDAPPLVLGAPPSRIRGRHWLVAASFIVLVVLPTLVAAAYLIHTAADRYGSRVAFSIRSSESSAPLEILGAMTQIGGSSMLTDGQVLYDFIQSQQIVEAVNAELPLEAYWNRAPADWVYALGEDQPVEELVEHWNRMVDVSLDSSTGIVTIEARAFRAGEARAISAAILEASSELVNRLADIARSDAVRHAALELKEAETDLRTIRAKLREFRDVEQEVDPSANARVAVELVAQLEEELSQARVQLQILRSALDESAPRIGLLKRQIESLEGRIAAERTRLGRGSGSDSDRQRPLSAVVGDYEELVVDREFAEQSYTMTLATYQQAQAEARRRHRYLAPHIEPTLSEDPEYPDRPLLIGVVFLLALGVWSILVLGAYSIRDRG